MAEKKVVVRVRVKGLPVTYFEPIVVESEEE